MSRLAVLVASAGVAQALVHRQAPGRADPHLLASTATAACSDAPAAAAFHAEDAGRGVGLAGQRGNAVASASSASPAPRQLVTTLMLRSDELQRALPLSVLLAARAAAAQ
jgi:hypothetical protein